ncbi:FecR family protein [Paraflavitalea speifideaquila]|uniref:FecR family protein n=1 Tax=Paraflavitalea speifideaquila TaxID=3076558 RepID=UPI0028E28F41|nr:FecR domain-containing protein [Paraflavitalea speifideiaquila]
MIPGDTIINIIAKQLNGRATAEDQAQLQQWLELDPTNQQEYEELVKAWEESIRLTEQHNFKTDEAWARIEAKTKPAEVGEVTGRTFNLYPRRLAVTAAVVGLLIVGGYLWNHYRTSWQELAAGNNNKSLQLPDGSTVLLRKGATLRYPLHFEGEERLIRLSGEAFFTVQRDEHQPFVVMTDHAAVRVLGTSFLVNADDKTEEVIVVAGKVCVISKHLAGQQVELTAGQRTVLQNDQFQQSAVTDSNFIAWNTGLLDFKNTPLCKCWKKCRIIMKCPSALPPAKAPYRSPYSNSQV